MIYSTPSLQPTKFTDSSSIGIDHDLSGWIAWMPYDGIAPDRSMDLRKWKEMNLDKLDKMGWESTERMLNSWSQSLSRFVPPFPIKSILLIMEPDRVQLIPVKGKVNKSGLEPLSGGWQKLWKDLLFEPTSRIIEIKKDRFSLLEIRGTDCRESVSIPAGTSFRYQVMRSFLASIIRLYRNDPGPILIRSSDPASVEIDHWLLSAYLPIQACWKTENGTDPKAWWQNMDRQGYAQEWKRDWAIQYIQKAKRDGNWIEKEALIRRSLEKDQIRMLILSKSSPGPLNPSDENIERILTKHITILNIDSAPTGAIVYHS